MKETSSCQSCESCENTSPRRKFLQSAAVAAGGLVLGLQAASNADEAKSAGTEDKPTEAKAAANFPALGETLFALPQAVLETVGAFEFIETEEDKIIVARTGPANIVACSAICTHKGCTVKYNHEDQQFICPCHGARYELTGKVVKGPAKRDLKAYQARPILGLSPSPDNAAQK